MIIIFLLSHPMQESRPLLSLAMTSEVRVSDGDGTHEGSTIQEEASGANL